MRVISVFLMLFLFVFSELNAQKNISLEDIWRNGTFRQEYLESLRSLNNGEEYSLLKYDAESRSIKVEKYSYKTGEHIGTIANSTEIQGLDYFQSYAFNAQETALLLGKDLESIYRRSSKGLYFVYDLSSKKLQAISSHKISQPTFSPDGKKIAYAYENNLYVLNLLNGNTEQITVDGKTNHIINGTTDWVYEEEFAFVRAFDWSTDSKKIGFLKFDESQVPQMTMEYYGSSPQQLLYPYPYQFKYPKAGDPNSKVSLHIYDLEKQETHPIKLNKAYEYLPRIQWTKEANLLSIQAMNRHQNELDLIYVDTKDYSTHLILSETDKNYIDITDDLTFLDDNSFIWSSEKSNWNHLYHYSKTGKLLHQITSGDWDVTQYYGYDAKTNRIFYQSTENGSINRDVYAIGLNGKKKQRLSPKTGTNSADFSKNFQYFINTYNSIETPYEFSLRETKTNKEIRVIEDNQAFREVLKAYNLSKKEISTISINGYDLNMWMIKPTDFDPNKKYPLFLYQYSGPGSQQVSNTFHSSNDYWHQMLADKGYIVACVDGRGTGFKGADFKKMTQLELGKYEVEDQIAVAKKLGQEKYIDETRIGIWGWSYGGFMSSNALLQGADTFKMAIAVAPVTSWRFYDTVYTERFMTTPQENPSGYDDNSPITHVDKLKGNLLLVHGSGDDNVHVQNTMQMVEALIQAGKQFDWLIYPDNDHGIYGGDTRYHLYTKMTNYILENL